MNPTELLIEEYKEIIASLKEELKLVESERNDLLVEKARAEHYANEH